MDKDVGVKTKTQHEICTNTEEKYVELLKTLYRVDIIGRYISKCMWISRLRKLSYVLVISTPMTFLLTGRQDSGLFNILAGTQVYIFIVLVIMTAYYLLRRYKPCYLLSDTISIEGGVRSVIVDTRRRLTKLKEMYDLVRSRCLSS